MEKMNVLNISWLKDNKCIIRSVSDLTQLRREIRYARPRKYSHVSLGMPLLSAEENAYVEQRIGAYYFLCGCTHGKIAAVAGTLLALTGFELGSISYTVQHLMVASSAVAAVSIGVKVLAQVHAKWSLTRYLNELIALLTPIEKTY
ncbi:hypothetical protein [Vibrio coralliilyticus]|uniref:hypothetical protein n=2 Tax=Vibrio coralliilyticus TaxID=190893 RepID=UPI00117FEBCD|nr:hypothetical protein [Vibrio coralliilyticus]NOI59149.1 hypothetical protein [Vibrio coralliilyticus]WFB51270.1 hypothetical protein P6988_25755 [Vibrio coralliilyticus]